jgi:hypothetical protein
VEKYVDLLRLAAKAEAAAVKSSTKAATLIEPALQQIHEVHRRALRLHLPRCLIPCLPVFDHR